MIQGCGYPELQPVARASRATIWQTGEPARARRVRRHRLGRALPRRPSYGGSDIPGVCIADEVAPRVPADRDQRARHRPPGELRLPVRRLRPQRRAGRASARRSRRSTPRPPAEAQPIRSYLGDSGVATLAQQRELPAGARPLRDRPVAGDPGRVRRRRPQHGARPARDREDHLRRRAGRCPNVNARFFQLSNGGYDTHSDQGGGRDRRPALRAAQGGRRLAQGLLRRPRRHGRRRAGCASSCGASSPPHPAERQRHRPRLAGADVRRSAAPWSAASTATIPTSSTSTTTRTPSTRRTADHVPLDRLPRRVRHDPEALAQHDRRPTSWRTCCRSTAAIPRTYWTSAELRPGLPAVDDWATSAIRGSSSSPSST